MGPRSKPEKNFSGMVFLWQDHGSQSGSRHFSIPNSQRHIVKNLVKDIYHDI